MGLVHGSRGGGVLTRDLDFGLRAVKAALWVGPAGTVWWDLAGIPILLPTPPGTWSQAYFFSAAFFLVPGCSGGDQTRGTESPTAWDLSLRLGVWQKDEEGRAIRRKAQPLGPGPLTQGPAGVCSPWLSCVSEMPASCKKRWV